jgi:4-hydroxy-tetrahydrodipicolinate synthase
MSLTKKGIIPPIITPLLNRNEMDKIGIKNLIEHLITGGVQRLFTLGINVEAPSLSYSLRKEFISRTCKIANKRVPVSGCKKIKTQLTE